MTQAAECAASDSDRHTNGDDHSVLPVPRPLEPNRETLRRRLDGAAHVLCCLDFDGTLAPIVDEPDAARILPENRRAVEALVDHPAITVAIVSGRELRDLESRVPSSVHLAGNHGLEWLRPEERDGRRVIHPIARAARPRIRHCCGLLDRTLAALPGVNVEYKGLSGTVHHRNAPSGLDRLVETHVRAVVERCGEDRLTITTGKAIVEFTPSIDWGKGRMVELLGRDRPAETVTVFVGDDTTDEDAFEVVEPDGVGILVGESRPSAASLRLESPAAVSHFLTRLDATMTRPAPEAADCDRTTS